MKAKVNSLLEELKKRLEAASIWTSGQRRSISVVFWRRANVQARAHFSAVADVCSKRGVAESLAAPVASVTGTRCICFQLASTSSVSGRLHVPLLSGESGV